MECSASVEKVIFGVSAVLCKSHCELWLFIAQQVCNPDLYSAPEMVINTKYNIGCHITQHSSPTTVIGGINKAEGKTNVHFLVPPRGTLCLTHFAANY